MSDIPREIAYMMNHGSSPEAEAARTLQRFMCCKAGEDLVEHGLLRPFGYSLEPGRVMTAYRLLKGTLDVVEADLADDDLRNATRDFIRRQVAKADAFL